LKSVKINKQRKKHFSFNMGPFKKHFYAHISHCVISLYDWD
jgi:hypothetical protein